MKKEHLKNDLQLSNNAVDQRNSGDGHILMANIMDGNTSKQVPKEEIVVTETIVQVSKKEEKRFELNEQVIMAEAIQDEPFVQVVQTGNMASNTTVQVSVSDTASTDTFVDMKPNLKNTEVESMIIKTEPLNNYGDLTYLKDSDSTIMIGGSIQNNPDGLYFVMFMNF